jgi:hypothetical protein
MSRSIGRNKVWVWGSYLHLDAELLNKNKEQDKRMLKEERGRRSVSSAANID